MGMQFGEVRLGKKEKDGTKLREAIILGYFQSKLF